MKLLSFSFSRLSDFKLLRYFPFLLNQLNALEECLSTSVTVIVPALPSLSRSSLQCALAALQFKKMKICGSENGDFEICDPCLALFEIQYQISDRRYALRSNPLFEDTWAVFIPAPLHR
jgi:hypothetical protein